MTSPENLHTKHDINELSFPLVTYTTYFDTLFGSYGFLRTEHGAQLFWTERI
jgi:hypothetical protein